MLPSYSLFVLQGQDRGHSFELNPPAVTLGRDSCNSITLIDGEVSRYHARIDFTDIPTIFDLDSSNGIMVNGKKVEQQQQLVNKDRIQIGRSLFVFIVSSAEKSPEKSPSVISSSPPYSPFTHSSFVHPSPASSFSVSPVHTIIDSDGEIFFQSIPADFADNDWFQKIHSHLNLIYHTTLVVSRTLDINLLLENILSLIFDWVAVDYGCILLCDPDKHSLTPAASRSRGNRINPVSPSISKTILDFALNRDEGVLTGDAQKDQRWQDAESVIHRGVKEAICVPMRGRYGLVGTIYVDTIRPAVFLQDVEKQNLSPAEEQSDSSKQSGTKKLTTDHLKLMIVIGHQAALAIENTQYYLKMVQAERLAAMGQTVTHLSHHIKNILQGIRGGSYLIDLGLKQHDEIYIRQGWSIMEKNQARISDLILDMLSFSKEREPIFEPTDLNKMINEIVELMNGRTFERPFQLEWFPDPALPSFAFDAAQLHHAVTNILANAIDAVTITTDETEPEEVIADDTPSKVTIRTSFVSQDETQKVIITIDDNGPGIPPEDRQTVFRPFVSKKKRSGTGLGLAVTQKIIQDHRGEIEITESPLGGARFTVALPFSSG